MVRTDVLIFFVNLVIIIRKMKHYTVIQLQESPLLSPPPPPRLQLLDLKITISEIIQLPNLPPPLRLQHRQQQQQQQQQQLQQQQQQQRRLKKQVKA